MKRTLAYAAEGHGLERERALWTMEHAELDVLLKTAQSIRKRFHGCTVSFSKKVFIPLTTLCRDRCGYCIFRRDPGQPDGRYLTPEEVLEVARSGRRAGCKEALFSLGDQPERAFPAAREFLQRYGFGSTLEYLAAMTRLVLEETGLLPHSNPGLMARTDLQALKTTNASMGLMLENVSPRLTRRGEAHGQAPDKAPHLRVLTIEAAGRLNVAFTTGILVGIGETRQERLDSLFAIRDLHLRHGHIQEVIVQNFRAKGGTPMAGHSEVSTEEMLRTIAVARLVLPGEMNIQAPPNLSAPDYERLLDAGINDWGGISPVTRDFINPEAPWPQIPSIAEKTAQKGLKLRERLALYPEFIRRREYVPDTVRPRLAALADPEGYAKDGGSDDDYIG
ncbi:MAG: 7,8-didemethyl-8-hydroxy-5-deazariboflavin synthase CofG [Terriglobia bacterium]